MTGVDRLPQFEESLSIVQNNQQSTNPPRKQRARKNLLSTRKIRCDQDLIKSAARSLSYLVDLSQQEKHKSFGFEACDRKALLGGLLRIGISIRRTCNSEMPSCSESARSRMTSVRTSLLGTYLAGARYGIY